MQTTAYPRSSDMFDEILDGFVERAELEMAKMRKEGIEPAERGENWIHAGTMVFSVSVRSSAPGRLQLRLSGAGRKNEEVYLIGLPWPRHPAEAGADDILDALAAFWPSIASPYLVDGAHWPESMALRIPGVPVLQVARLDGWLSFSSDAGTVDTGSESVMAVETLRTIGDEIVRTGIVSPEAAGRWIAASSATDLPPCPPENWSETPDEAHLSIDRAADAWFARRFGISTELWRLSAGLTSARHLLHWKTDEGTEPAPEEWSPSWTADVPEDQALALIDRAALLEGKTRERYLDDAAHDRSMTARGAAVFAREKERRERLAGRAEGMGPS